MAGEGDREGLLVPLLPEHDDSGIDSDDTERARAQRVDELLQLAEPSSSDEDPMMKLPWIQRCMKRKLDDQFKSMEEGRLEHNVMAPMAQWQRRGADKRNDTPDSPDRSSPPLFEVELTASDEDDDASVLELVIPVHCPNYKKPSPSTPKEILDFLREFCCPCFGTVHSLFKY